MADFPRRTLRTSISGEIFFKMQEKWEGGGGEKLGEISWKKRTAHELVRLGGEELNQQLRTWIILK